MVQAYDTRVRKGKVDVLQNLSKEETRYSIGELASVFAKKMKKNLSINTHESKLSLWLPPKGMLTLFTVAKATSFLAVLLIARKASHT